jgi:ADP-ribose pyrophosphatase YjhB (NUDIX family)
MLDGWRTCPRCTEPLSVFPGRVECAACAFVAYANSAPTASALVVDETGRVLLARRAVEPFRGRWDIPGGFLEEHEHPEDALRRELREETGLEIEPTAFLGIWMDWYGEKAPGIQATLNLYWLARATGEAEPHAADDVDELRWFRPDELPPPDELAFSNTGRVLDVWRKQQSQRAGVAAEA